METCSNSKRGVNFQAEGVKPSCKTAWQWALKETCGPTATISEAVHSITCSKHLDHGIMAFAWLKYPK